MAADNEPGEVALRANTLVDRRRVARAASCRWPRTPTPACPRRSCSRSRSTSTARRCGGEGAFLAQSRAAMLVARALEPAPDERVLDLCAAPGGKSTHLAALMGDRGEVVAVERDRAAPAGSCAPRGGCARPTSASRSPTRDAARGRGAVRPRARRPAVLRPRDAAGAPRPALAGHARRDRGDGACAGADPRRRRRRPSVRGACLSTLRARSPRLRMSA